MRDEQSSDDFAYFFIKTYVVGAHSNRLAETILMSTHNIGFYEDLTKIIFELSIIRHVKFSKKKCGTARDD